MSFQLADNFFLVVFLLLLHLVLLWEGALCILLTLVAERKVEILGPSNCSGKIELFCTEFFQVVFLELCTSRVAILVPQKFQVCTVLFTDPLETTDSSINF